MFYNVQTTYKTSRLLKTKFLGETLLHYVALKNNILNKILNVEIVVHGQHILNLIIDWEITNGPTSFYKKMSK